MLPAREPPFPLLYRPTPPATINTSASAPANAGARNHDNQPARTGWARSSRIRAQPVRAGWLSWFRAPALAGALALVLMVAGGVGLYNKGKGGSRAGNIEVPQVATAGTAVGDLQALDKNEDLYANFDVLDDLQVQPDVDADQETP